MKRWLLDHLVRYGYVTESGTTRSAKIRGCPKCHEPVLVGLDDIQCAFEVRADPVPLSPLGEALALLEGRRTVAANREAGRFVINPRWAAEVAAHPAGTQGREDVLRQHRCGTPAMSEAMTAESSFAVAANHLPPNAPAPF